MFKFKPISSDKIKEEVLDFYKEEEIKYFSISKNNKITGYFGLQDEEDNRCELHIHILPEHRFKVLSKNFINQLISFIFDLGYDTILTSTKLKSWISLLNYYSKYGVLAIQPRFKDLEKHCFMIRRSDYG